jgi:hypothetical protein
MGFRPHTNPSRHDPTRAETCGFRPARLARPPATGRASVKRGSLAGAGSGCFVALLAIVGLVRGGPAERGREIFTDVTDQAGITWKHFNGESPDRHLIETKNGGLAFLDFDHDGRLDIFLVQGGETPHGKSPVPLHHALYRNLGNGRFEDVAAKAGVDHVAGFPIGVAVGDYDNDGYPDLYLTGFPVSTLYHNNRDGTFTDVTDRAGVRNPGQWATNAIWFDYDRDGLLDLLVCRYGQMTFDKSPHCLFRNMPAYCAPQAYGLGDRLLLFHNNGDGTFKDVSAVSGVQKYVGRALSAVAIDLNDDGWPDLFVTRDGSANLLLMNQKNGTFEDSALDADVAYDPNGLAKAGMGIDAADVNGDGWPDFVMTAFDHEYHSLFLNPGHFPFEDWTIQSGLAGLTAPYVGWGAHFLDFDNDGVMDLMIVSGHVNKAIEEGTASSTYKQPPLLLKNDGRGVFRNVKETAGPAFQKAYDARGLAVGDFDNDGDTDVIFACLQDHPVLLRNNLGQDNNWIGFELRGTKSNRDAIGGKLVVEYRGRKLVRWVTGGSSIFSSSDHRVIVGLGKGPPPATLDVEIRWPNGETETARNLAPNRYHEIVESPGR